MKNIAKFVKDGAFIQGGSYRLDKGPTKTEIETFRLATVLHEECSRSGRITTLGCLVNDLGVFPPSERPKTKGEFDIPTEYVEILRSQVPSLFPIQFEFIKAGKHGKSQAFSVKATNSLEIKIFFESTIRNSARCDEHLKKRFALDRNDEGVPIVSCPIIMGRLYHILARQGYSQQIGFYAVEQKEQDDHSCSHGPVHGTVSRNSGYTLELPVLNYLVTPSGNIYVGCGIEPDK